VSIALLIVFLASTLFAIVFVLTSRHSIAIKLAIVATSLAFAAVSYLLATSSAISPFSHSSKLSYGLEQGAGSIGVALFGAIAGVFGSYVFNLGTASFNLRGLLRPLSACPLVIVPTVKPIESASDQSALAYILLFALSYQNGFFWERLLKRE
jgi:hypothetical protein